MTSLRVLAGLLLTCATAQADARLELFDADGTLVYLGREQEQKDGDRVERLVRYCHLDGRFVLQSRARFDAASGRALSIRTEDRQAGKSTVTDIADDSITFATGARTTSVARPAELVVSEGLEDFVRSRWKALSTGNPVEFEMAITQYSRTLRFRLVREREDGTAVVLRLEPKLWVLRKLAEPVFFHFAKEAPHRLLESLGPSAVTDADGKLQILRAVYASPDARPLPCASGP